MSAAYPPRTREEDRQRKREVNRRFRARRTLWRVIRANPGARLGDLMQGGRERGLSSVEMWPRELDQLLRDGDVIAPSGRRRELYVTDRPNRYDYPAIQP